MIVTCKCLSPNEMSYGVIITFERTAQLVTKGFDSYHIVFFNKIHL